MNIISLQTEIFILIFVGYVLSKFQVIDIRLRKGLSNLVLKVVLPASIIQSFELEMTFEILVSCIWVLIASVLIQLLYAFCNLFLWKKQNNPDHRICLQYATMVSNAGFMGMPIAQAAFGAQGLLYSSIFLIPQRIAMWSVGLSLFSKKTSKKELISKVLFHPCIVALGIGVLFMLAEMHGFQMPESIDRSLAAIGGCSTALSMIVIGSILSEVHFSEFLDQTSLWYSAIRTIILPLIILIGCQMVGFSGLGMAVCVLESAMPAPSTVVMLAEGYDRTPLFASRLVFVSTIFSLITLPVWMVFLSGF